MRELFFSTFSVFLTWWGAFILAFLDSSVLLFLPLGNDALVIYLAARDRDWFWIYPLIVTAGSTTGAAFTYWVGSKVGEAGLPRLVSTRRLDRVKRKLHGASAFAMALPAALPPPFPLTAFLLTSGALEMSRWRVLTAFAAARLARFGVEAYFARRYGDHVLAVLESEMSQIVIMGLVLSAIVATIITLALVWRRTP